jgi:plasmid stabilization system protein ParE
MPSPSDSPCSANILAWAAPAMICDPACAGFAVGQYVIVYAVEDEDVEILHVFHGRQDIEGQFGH